MKGLVHGSNDKLMYQVFEVPDIATAQSQITAWAAKGWFLEDLQWYQKTVNSGGQGTYVQFYTIVMAKPT